jgi:hypothetical protein
MPQRSKLIRSRDEWKNKAVSRADKIRECRKTEKRLKGKIAELKRRVEELKQAAGGNQEKPVPAVGGIVKPGQPAETRTLCVLLVVQAVVSYRSVPRILDLLGVAMAFRLGWVPHFTAVINWTLRLGLGLLKQVKAIDFPWLAIIDHSIDIGTKKALVVLRVTLDALSKRGGAIRLEDCECIGLKISETVNGESVARDLGEVFMRAGTPQCIVKDCDATLRKGVRLWSEGQGGPVHVIDDIWHSMANALRDEFEGTASYERFTALTTQCANRLRQTDLAFLMPPKLRSKGRFQSIGNIGKWGGRMLDMLAVKGGAKKGSLLARLRTALPGFLLLKPFILRFADTTQAVSQAMEIIKSQGLDQASYEQCITLSEQLPKKSKVKRHLQNWLARHMDIWRQMAALPLMASSDIIESLFGNFKHIIERSPQADMNRSALLIPALCGNLDNTTITRALNLASHHDLQMWERENIPYTVRKKRQAFFKPNESRKAGNDQLE